MTSNSGVVGQHLSQIPLCSGNWTKTMKSWSLVEGLDPESSFRLLK